MEPELVYDLSFHYLGLGVQCGKIVKEFDPETVELPPGAFGVTVSKVWAVDVMCADGEVREFMSHQADAPQTFIFGAVYTTEELLDLYPNATCLEHNLQQDGATRAVLTQFRIWVTPEPTDMVIPRTAAADTGLPD